MKKKEHETLELFILLELILKQQNYSQLYVAKHIIACYRCCHYITERTVNPQEINQKDVILLDFASYNPLAILL